MIPTTNTANNTESSSSIGKKGSGSGSGTGSLLVSDTDSRSQGRSSISLRTSDKFKAMIDKLMFQTPSKPLIGHKQLPVISASNTDLKSGSSKK
jgi:hypothetical protein